MEQIIKEVAGRIRETRLVCELSEEDMATATGVSVETYRELEAGNADFSFTFIYSKRCCFPLRIVILTSNML